MKQIQQSFKSNVICPNCHKSHQETFITLVESVTDAKNVNAILTGNLNQKTCPHCGTVVTYSYPLLYHNALNKTLIGLAYPSTRELKAYENLLQGYSTDKVITPWLQTHTVRLTISFAFFQEKILLDQLKLDDAIIEIAKAKFNLPEDSVFVSFDQGFLTLSTNTYTPFTKEDYDKLTSSYKILKEDIYVNRDYANDVLQAD